MRAVEIAAFGGPENLKTTERPAPEPAPGQVVVAVETAGVGLADVLIRRGMAPGVEPGIVPGLEVAGTVVAAGADEDRHWVGRRVFASTEAGGGYAEQAVVPTAALVALPDDVTTADAVALGVNALVAEASLERAAVVRGERVLVRGASGGIGVLVVQLAAALGATVVASVSDPSRADRLRDLGAAEVVGPEPTVAGPDRRYDVVIDVVAGPDLAAFVRLLHPNGRYVVNGIAAGPPVPDFGMVLFENFQQSWTISALSLTSSPRSSPTSSFENVLAALGAGTVRPVVHSVLPLAEAATAHERLESRSTFGKVLLTVG